MPVSRTAFCLFCDDVRMELGNKPSYMGVYAGGEMQFSADIPPDVPIFLPKFAIVTWVFTAIDDPLQRVTIRVYGPPGRTQLLELGPSLEGPAPPSYSDAERLSLVFSLPIMNFHFPCEGTLEVVVDTERETLRAGRLRIRIPGRPDPTVSQAEETPPDTPSTQASSAKATSRRRRKAS